MMAEQNQGSQGGDSGDFSHEIIGAAVEVQRVLGTGLAEDIYAAALAIELGALTVAVVTKPFTVEGKKRMRQAEEGLAELDFFEYTKSLDGRFGVVAPTEAIDPACRYSDDVLERATERDAGHVVDHVDVEVGAVEELPHVNVI